MPKGQKGRRGPTKNDLNSPFMFINKDAKDAESGRLTSSEGIEKQAIYGHVRRQNFKPLLQSKEQTFESVFRPASADRTRRRQSLKHSRHGPKATNRAVDTAPIQSLNVPDAQTTEIQQAQFHTNLPMFRQPDITLYARSFVYFRHMTIAEATGFSDVRFWDRSMQLSHSHKAVFYALMSLGALYESLVSDTPTSRESAWQTSLMHCNHAIGAIRQAGSTMPLPLSLITCVIFATIQIFVDAETAQRTLESGINMAFDAQRKDTKFSASQTELLDMATKMMQRYQSRLTLVLGPMSIVREHATNETPEPKPSVPNAFGSLLEARGCLQRICDWSFRLQKDSASLVSIDTLQRQWLSAVDQFTRDTKLHPLSTRSLNLLKIARLASACLLAAQYLSPSSDFHTCFPMFQKLLNIYKNEFALSNSREIFIDVFGINDDVSGILARAEIEGISTPLPVSSAGTADSEFWPQFFFGGSTPRPTPDQGRESDVTSRDALLIQGLDFFARTGEARVRLKGVGRRPVEHRFHLVEKTANSGTDFPGK